MSRAPTKAPPYPPTCQKISARCLSCSSSSSLCSPIVSQAQGMSITLVTSDSVPYALPYVALGLLNSRTMLPMLCLKLCLILDYGQAGSAHVFEPIVWLKSCVGVGLGGQGVAFVRPYIRMFTRIVFLAECLKKVDASTTDNYSYVISLWSSRLLCIYSWTQI